MRYLKMFGPFSFLIIAILSAISVAYLMGARDRQLLPSALLAIPLTFAGILLHDVIDNTFGMSNFDSTALVVAITSAVGSALLNGFLRRSS